jgi:hypothetical protein
VDSWLTEARDALARAAPLLCYLVGRAQGGAGLDELADAVRASST